MFYLFVNGNAETMSPDKETLERMAEEIKADGKETLECMTEEIKADGKETLERTAEEIKADGKETVVAEFELSLDPCYLELVDGVVQVKKPPADAPIDAGTEAQKKAEIAQLDTQYQADKAQLMQYYFEFSITEDTEGMASIKQELADLAAQYDAALAEIEGGE